MGSDGNDNELAVWKICAGFAPQINFGDLIMGKMVNVDINDIALHALVAAAIKKTHPHLFENHPSQLSGLGRLRWQRIIQSRVARGLSPRPTKIMTYTAARAAEDVITIIRGAVNRGWLDPKYLASGWNFYTRMDQVVVNALNALVAIQITVTKNKTNINELTNIQNGFVLPIDRVFENITSGLSNVCGGAWEGTDCAMNALGLTKQQLLNMQKLIAQWQPMRNKIFDMFNKDGMYKGQGWLSTVMPIVAGVAAVAAPALIFASSGIGAAGATGGAAASGAVSTGAAAGGGVSAGTVASTAGTAATVASGAKAAADVASGGSKAAQAVSDTAKAADAVKKTADVLKTGGSLATHVAQTVANSGILQDAQKIAGAVLASKGVNANAAQSQAAINAALQRAQQLAQSQLQNGNVKSNSQQQQPANGFTWSKVLPFALSGGAILMEAMRK